MAKKKRTQFPVSQNRLSEEVQGWIPWIFCTVLKNLDSKCISRRKDYSKPYLLFAGVLLELVPTNHATKPERILNERWAALEKQRQARTAEIASPG